MRIIAGEYKGRKLASPLDDRVRPTTDKAKEAIFSILTNEIYGSYVLDLFAGSGNLGLEALSRGAEHCWFAAAAPYSKTVITKYSKNTAPNRKAAKTTPPQKHILRVRCKNAFYLL